VAIISNAVTMADAGAFSVGLGAMTLIKTLTLSNAATASFVHGASSVVLDSTYPIYRFEFINCHPVTNSAEFTFNGRDGSTAYDATKTTSAFATFNHETSSETAAINYNADIDTAQGTGFQTLTQDVGSDNDQHTSGTLTIYNPSSTTFVKHFMSTSVNYHSGDYAQEFFVGGYFNVTAAIDAIQFKFSTGNIDSGIIKLYGIKDS
jgi:hypothetical protein